MAQILKFPTKDELDEQADLSVNLITAKWRHYCQKTKRYIIVLMDKKCPFCKRPPPQL